MEPNTLTILQYRFFKIGTNQTFGIVNLQQLWTNSEWMKIYKY